MVNPGGHRREPVYGVELMTSAARDDDPRFDLPVRRQFAVTWGIPDAFGGMTAAMLHRSRSFVQLAGATVDILTFEPRPDMAAVRSRLTGQGELIRGMHLRNLYEDLRHVERMPQPVPVRPDLATPPRGECVASPGGSLWQWREAGEVVRAEHRRADGSLALLDERRRVGPRRLITSFDPVGVPTGQWRSASALYFDWLDTIVADEPAVAIVDSKTTANILQHYRRDHVTTIHLVHGSHRGGGDRVSVARRDVFENLHRWDALVLLTEHQRHEVVGLLGDSGNLAVAPNAVTAPSGIDRLPQDQLHGVIVSRMSRLKRLDHALRIIAEVRAAGVPATAEIVGDGGQRSRLEAEARRLGLGDAVRFTGYLAGGAERFSHGAWTLLTSISEGCSLSLVEAMAAGCVPVSYDIRYGPAEVIDHGRSGWLVPDGDVEAAARLLARQCGLGEDETAAMRRAARQAAMRHTDAEVVPRWAEIERAAVDRHATRPPAADAVLDLIRVGYRGGRYRVSARVREFAADADVAVRLVPIAGAGVRVPLHRVGRRRLAIVSRETSRALGGGAVRTLFLVSADDEVAYVDAGLRHPDRRPLHRRVWARLARLLERVDPRRLIPTR